jgi:DNA-binding response OmpR family regulator
VSEGVVIGGTSGRTSPRPRCQAKHGSDSRPIDHLLNRLRGIERQLARLERLCGTALEDLGLLADDLDAADAREGGASRVPSLRRRRSRVIRVGVVATAIDARSRRIRIVAGGVTQEFVLTSLHAELVALLAASTAHSPDHLVGFKPLGTIVHGLRRRHGRVSGRSVTVAISRLRELLGPSYGGLIETARGVGYRIRLMAVNPSSLRADR